MKKTLLALAMVGSSLAVFAQTTPTTPTQPAQPTSPTTSPTTAPTTTNPTTSNPATITSPMTPTTSDPIIATPNSQMNNPTTVNTSTSWAPGTSPYWGWNSYGIWNNNSTTNVNNGSFVNANSNANVNANTNVNNSTNTNVPATDATMANDNLNSTGSYDAYGTAVTSLPYYVQQNFPKDFPNPTNNQYKWNQYGDWFSTYYQGNGRLTQYFYDERGRGYALSLPVIQTYVPEDIIDKALQKYGAKLYSVGMVKSGEGKDAYLVGLLERGQVHTEYLNEDGSAVANVWRIEQAEMSSTSANAAMDSQGNAVSADAQGNNATVTDGTGDSQMNSPYQDTTGKQKMKMKHKGGKSKTKSHHKSNPDSTSTSSGMKEQ